MHARFITLEMLADLLNSTPRATLRHTGNFWENISNSSVTHLVSASSSYPIVIPLLLDTNNYCSLLKVILVDFAYPVEVLWFLALK